MLQKRKDDKGSILWDVPIPTDHPENITTSIALKPISKTSDVFEKSLSRFFKE
jgi:hypothetical protein